MRQCFTVDLVKTDRNGNLSRLYSEDLVPVAHMLRCLRLLDGLDNDFLGEIIWLPFPKDSEGSWIFFPLDFTVLSIFRREPEVFVFGQWDPGMPEMWDSQLGYGALKVVRVVSREKSRSLIEALRQSNEGVLELPKELGD